MLDLLLNASVISKAYNIGMGINTKLSLILIGLTIFGCGESKVSTDERDTTNHELTLKYSKQKTANDRNLVQEKALAEDIIQQIHSRGTITDQQADFLGKCFSVNSIDLNNLTSITDKQAELLSTVSHIEVNGLTYITEKHS